ncbi:MAG: HAMP domain-containing sensor histidine kinase [Nitrospirota bacterium]
MIVGYIAIFLLVMAVSIYAVIQLRQFSTTTHDILEIDNRLIDYEKRLTDSLLSQVRYERKYLIIKDRALYDQFIAAAGDFTRSIDAALSLGGDFHREGVDRIRRHHGHYVALFEKEAALVRGAVSYEQAWYRQQKELAITDAMEELKRLRASSQQNTYERIRQLGDAGVRARSVMGGLAVAALVLGVAISVVITRSITRPIAVMIDKTREVANGVLKGDLALSSPPEIGELSTSFNAMCRKLRALDKMKSDFFSTMSHELRTPLTSIREGTSLLLEGKGGEATEKQRRLLTIISEESNRLIGLVNSLMDLSKMEAGMMAFTLTDTALAPLLHKAAAEAELLASVKKIALDISCAPDLPAVCMDGERILQALRNLIGNAIKFTPEGGRVSVAAAHDDRGVRVAVSDTGPGIGKEYLTVVFEKFQQVPLADSYKVKGTGLGLAIVNHIITAHGGSVWAESEPGQGSSFIFVLPA